jgi:hypothetical protein
MNEFAKLSSELKAIRAMGVMVCLSARRSFRIRGGFVHASASPMSPLGRAVGRAHTKQRVHDAEDREKGPKDMNFSS